MHVYIRTVTLLWQRSGRDGAASAELEARKAAARAWVSPWLVRHTKVFVLGLENVMNQAVKARQACQHAHMS